MSAGRGLRHHGAAGMLAMFALGGLGACGVGGDGQGATADELAAAKEEGRREAAADAKVEEAAAETKRLRKEIDELKQGRSGQSKGESSKTVPGTPAPSRPAVSPRGSGANDCGGGLAGSSNTSCGFARNVRDAYRSSSRASVISAYSPALDRVITMNCRGGMPSVCTGGNNAVVYIP